MKKIVTKTKTTKTPTRKELEKEDLSKKEITETVKNILTNRFRERSTICQGCYGIEETLTSTPHYLKIWTRQQIKLENKFFEEKNIDGQTMTDFDKPKEIEKDTNGKLVEKMFVWGNCKWCYKSRKIMLTTVGYNSFLEEWNDNSIIAFTLMKDFPDPDKQKYFVRFAGFSQKDINGLDLTEIIE